VASPRPTNFTESTCGSISLIENIDDANSLKITRAQPNLNNASEV
jgi:hypothetical protein